MPTDREKSWSERRAVKVTSGRASQEVFADLWSAVLHQCIRYLLGASRFTMRTDQEPGSQGGPFSHGCEANAPTRGANWQPCPSA
jgi:hypothetical protein